MFWWPFLLLAQVIKAISFRDGSSYNLEKFKAIAKDALNSDINLDPFCKSVMRGLLNDESGPKLFFEFIVNDFEHNMMRFDPNLPQSWDTLLNLAFSVFDRQVAEVILNETILPAYPILSHVKIDDVDGLLDDSYLISRALDELVLFHFHCKLADKDRNVKELLIDAKNSCAALDESFKYHFAFLTSVKTEHFYNLPSIDLCPDVECYFGSLAKTVYEKMSKDEARKCLCWVMPNVYDEIQGGFDDYETVIKEYVARERRECNSEHLNDNIFILRDLNLNHKMLTYATKHFGLLAGVESVMDYFIYSLNSRFDHRNDLVPSCESINEELVDFMIKFRLNEALKYFIENNQIDHRKLLVRTAKEGFFSLFMTLTSKYSVTDWRSLFEAAYKKANWNIVKFIMEKCATMLIDSSNIEYFLEDLTSFKLLQRAFNNGLELNYESTSYALISNILESAAEYGDIALIKKIVESGFKFHLKTVLDYAAFHGHVDIVKYLFERRREASCEVISDRDYLGEALTFAAVKGNTSVVEYIFNLSRTFLHLIEPKSIATAFAFASLNAHNSALALFNDYFPGGSPKELYEMGLIEACKVGRLDIVKHILNQNVSIDLREALKVSKAKKHFEIHEFIKLRNKLLR